MGGQLLIGKVRAYQTYDLNFNETFYPWQLAAIRQVTVRELHDEYGLTNDD